MQIIHAQNSVAVGNLLFYMSLQVHVSKQSNIPDHCRSYALSDPKETDYQIICPHDHILHLEICDRCDLLASVLADIHGALEKMSDSKGPCKRSQHCWPTRRNIVGPNMLQHVVCCCVLLRLVGSCWMKFDQFQTSSNNFQQVATTRNNTQHGVQTLATCWAQHCCVLLANNVASVCMGLNESRDVVQELNFIEGQAKQNI